MAFQHRPLAQQGKRVHVVFNNNMNDQGIRGARTLATLLNPFECWEQHASFAGFTDWHHDSCVARRLDD